MSLMRVFWVGVVAAGLVSCGGAPSDSPSGTDAAGQEPQPTAVFSDDFETGEADDWQKVDKNESDAEGADGQTDSPPPE